MIKPNLLFLLRLRRHIHDKIWPMTKYILFTLRYRYWLLKPWRSWLLKPWELIILILFLFNESIHYLKYMTKAIPIVTLTMSKSQCQHFLCNFNRNPWTILRHIIFIGCFNVNISVSLIFGTMTSSYYHGKLYFINGFL